MPVASSSGAAVEYRVTPQGFRELFVRTAKFDETLAKELRTNIRGAALSVVSDVRTQVMGGSFTTDAGMRQGIADGLKVQVLTVSKSKPGVVIVASADRMPRGKALMLKAWQKVTFKHPVFGDKAVLVEQAGRPFFDGPIEANKSKVTTAVNKAMQQAADSLSRSGI